MVQRCICVALNEYMKPFRAAGTTTSVVEMAANSVATSERRLFRERLLKMEEDGSRYKNLEMNLGGGATLALGIELGES